MCFSWNASLYITLAVPTAAPFINTEYNDTTIANTNVYLDHHDTWDPCNSTASNGLDHLRAGIKSSALMFAQGSDLAIADGDASMSSELVCKISCRSERGDDNMFNPSAMGVFEAGEEESGDGLRWADKSASLSSSDTFVVLRNDTKNGALDGDLCISDKPAGLVETPR